MSRFLVFAIMLLGLLNPAHSQNFGDIFRLTSEGFWKDQWERLRVTTSIKALDVEVGRIAAVNASYEYLVEPAFVKGLHQRQDGWVASVATDTSKLKLTDGSPFGVNGSLSAHVTFSRLFPSKSEAMGAMPYWLNRIPWEAENVEKSLQEGDAVRIETFLDLSAGFGRGTDIGGFNLGASLSYSKGIRFLADVYRMKNNRIRIRLVGQRNDGTTGGGLSLNPLSKLDFGTGIINSWLGRVFHCSPAAFSISHSNFEDPPVDTQMVDYMINLNSPAGRDAYNQIMTNISHLRFTEVLNLNLIFESRSAYSTYMANKLLDIVKIAEHIFAEDKEVTVESRRVDRIFKGQTRSANSGYALRSDCFRIWDAAYSNNGSATFVENYDRFETITHQLFDATIVTLDKSAIFSLIEEKTRGNLSLLLEASADYKPTRFSDMDIAVDYTDKAFSEDEYADLKNHLKFILPPKTYAHIDWHNMDAVPGTKNNASYRYDIIFHNDALEALPALNEKEIGELLYAYIKDYPKRDSLPYISHSNTMGEGGNSTAYYDPMDKFADEINGLKHDLAILVDRERPSSDRRDAVTRLRQDLLFQNIGAGFMISMLPKEKADSLMSFRISMSCKEASIFYNNNINGLSNTFNAVEYILNLINDRGFDLRLQVDENGSLKPTRLQQEGSAKPLVSL